LIGPEHGGIPDRIEAVERSQAPYGLIVLFDGVAPAGEEDRLDAKIRRESGALISEIERGLTLLGGSTGKPLCGLLWRSFQAL
jgi:hypothetical protein